MSLNLLKQTQSVSKRKIARTNQSEPGSCLKKQKEMKKQQQQGPYHSSYIINSITSTRMTQMTLQQLKLKGQSIRLLFWT